MYIKDIAKILLGVSFRRAIQEEDKGSIRLIQPKNISVDADIKEKELIYIKTPNFRGRFPILEKGDILVITKGRFASCVFDLKQKCIIPGSMSLIRLNNNKTYLPKFVSIFLNSKIVKKEILKKNKQTTIFSISIKDIGELRLPKISIKKQKELISLFETKTVSNKFLKEKIKMQDKLAEALLQNTIKGVNNV